jgi:Co/Zn/Cd efflux system component
VPKIPGNVPQLLLRRAWRWLWPHRLAGFFLALINLGAVAYLAYKSTQPAAPPSVEQVVAITLIAFLANVISAFAFSRIGHVNADFARSSVRRLVTIARELRNRHEAMAAAIQGGTDRVILIEARVMHASVEGAIHGLTDAVEDWNEVHREALREVLSDGE